MSYQIEKGIPMPAPMRASKYPFVDMEIGDSFVAPADLGRVSRAAIHYTERHPEYRFACRKDKDGTRCWRIAVSSEIVDES